jgi:hypothetical protein
VLKEAGSVWRKLSVLRILNASEKDRVKNRSKEAERQQKSRKAIILDSTHSLVKNQGGGSGDVNGRRAPVKPKKELPKKIQKAVTSSPGNSLLSTFVAIPFISGLIRVCGPLILCIRAFVRPFKALACMGVMWW